MAIAISFLIANALRKTTILFVNKQTFALILEN